MTRFGLTRREVALVAGALLLPIPLLAATGLNVPLPGPVERAVASLLPSAVGASEPGASAVVPGSDAPARAAAAAIPPSASVTSRRGRGTASGAAGNQVHTKVGGPTGVDAPGLGDSPPDGGTPSGDEPGAGADPVPERTPPPPSLPLPDPVPPSPVLVPDDAVPDDALPEDTLPEELPIDVTVGEGGVVVDTGSGAAVEVTTEDGVGAGVVTPPLPSVPPLSLP